MFIIFISRVTFPPYLLSQMEPTYDMDLEDLLFSKILTWIKSVIIHHAITLSNEVKSHWGKSTLLYLHFGESKPVQDMV